VSEQGALERLLERVRVLEERTTELEHGYVRLSARLETTTTMLKRWSNPSGRSPTFEDALEQAELAALDDYQTTGRVRGRR
jgi:hypothetical protein